MLYHVHAHAHANEDADAGALPRRALACVRFLWRPRALDRVVACLDPEPSHVRSHDHDFSASASASHFSSTANSGSNTDREAARALWLTVHAANVESVARELPRAFHSCSVRFELPLSVDSPELASTAAAEAVAASASAVASSSAVPNASGPHPKRRRIDTRVSTHSYAYVDGAFVGEENARRTTAAADAEASAPSSPIVIRVVDRLNRFRVVGPRALDIVSHALSPADADRLLPDTDDSDPALRMLRAMASTADDDDEDDERSAALPAELHVDACERFACAVRHSIMIR